MKIQRQADGTFIVSESEGTWYVLIVKKTEADEPLPLCCCRILGRADKDCPAEEEGLRWSARHNAMGGRWCSVEIWQSVPGTWSEPGVLLETYRADGTYVVHSAPLPPATIGG